ncbi:DpnI domain-containing protein [Sulfurimonas sp.]|uniref:DpnI domain-containing protein n=1 Tax=Sulfurimonas sp. TaxID=2022749 RepID=UPI0025CCCEC7|nr:DpnI domain-containing protein [Sulfurimonas sp.]
MNLKKYVELSSDYKSNSQKTRVFTEPFVAENFYCPCCGASVIGRKNNDKVRDFDCSKCNENYELKSKQGKSLGKIVPDGAYNSMLERIENNSNPNFYFLNYDKENFDVINFCAVPNYFFTPNIIIPRKKGIPNRPNYIMCNIDISGIPNSGKIFYIKDKKIIDKSKVLEDWNKTSFLKESHSVNSKGWILDTLKCIEKLEKTDFTLNDMYQFEKELKLKHSQNNNIQAKIRQQLQILRDKNYLSFTNRGNYKLK